MTTGVAVLVIDDEPGIREMLSYELTLEGFEVETVESGLAAVQAVRRRKFDVAVTDLKMPGMDGIATVEALRSLDPEIEVIVATGYATVDTAVACMKNGAYDYIQKPYDLTELKLLLERAVQKSHLMGVVALYEASHALLSTLHHADLLNLVVTLAQRVLRGDSAGLVLARADGRGVEVHRLLEGAGPPDEVLIDLASQATRERRPLRLPPGTGQPAEDHAAALAYPLVAKDRTLGALVVVRGRGAPRFSPSELHKGTVFANQLALSLDNARLYENLQSKIAELVATREHLAQTEKVALAGRFAGAVAHEVNNPLSFVRVNLDAIRDYSSTVGGLWLAAKAAATYLRAQGDPASGAHAERLCCAAGDEERTDRMVRDIAEVVEDTLDGVQRIAELVAGFTGLATGDGDRSSEPVDVVALVHECVAALPRLAEPIHVVSGAGPVPTSFCREDLRTALMNILAHATSPARERQPGARVVVRIGNELGRPCIAVIDPALHLTAEERRRLFDPRLDVDTSRGRTMRLDIALALSCQLLHRHGGQVSSRDAEGGGTLFEVLLPTLEAVQ